MMYEYDLILWGEERRRLQSKRREARLGPKTIKLWPQFSTGK
ncbi:MAG: hypothetical protein PVF65_05295 [Sphingomonadales bacterium]